MSKDQALFRVRQFCSAVLVNLKTIANNPARETQPRVLLVRKRTVAKVEFNWVSGANVQQVLGRGIPPINRLMVRQKNSSRIRHLFLHLIPNFQT